MSAHKLDRHDLAALRRLHRKLYTFPWNPRSNRLASLKDRGLVESTMKVRSATTGGCELCIAYRLTEAGAARLAEERSA